MITNMVTKQPKQGLTKTLTVARKSRADKTPPTIRRKRGKRGNAPMTEAMFLAAMLDAGNATMEILAS